MSSLIVEVCEVALGRPYGYSLQLAGIDIPGQGAGNCYGTNGVAACGLTKMNQSGLIDHESTPDYTYCVGQTQGLIYGQGSSYPSVECLHELTRTTFWLPGQSTLLVCDRINLDDPRKLDLSKYNRPHHDAILAAKHLVEQVWHCPTVPVASMLANTASAGWSTTGGRSVKLDAFSTSGNLDVDVVDENVLWKDVGSIDADQKKWQFRVRPDADRQWNTIITMVRFSPTANNGGIPATWTQAEASGYSFNGITVLFGTEQGSRLIDSVSAANLHQSGQLVYLVGCEGSSPVVVLK